MPRCPVRLVTSAALVVLGGGVLASPARAATAPRIAVIVTSHEGLTPEAADEIASDIAMAAGSQIDGEAVSGSSVRDKLDPGDPEPGCEDRAPCGRKLALKLSVDEVLILAIKRINKVHFVACHRVARDPERVPSDAQLKLAGPRARRVKAISDVLATLYPPGSAAHYNEPAPETSATDADADLPQDRAPGRAGGAARRKTADTDEEPATNRSSKRANLKLKDAASKAPAADDKPSVWKKPWFGPVIAVVGAVVIAGVIVGVYYGVPPQATEPFVTLP